MFGLTALQHTLNPHSTLEKMIFLVDNVFTHTHRTTAIISFGALLTLILMRSFKNAFKKYWFIYRIPEVLVVVVVSTSKSISTVAINTTHSTPVLSDEFNWDEDGVDILGSVPINTGKHLVDFPLHRMTLRFLRKTTSTAVSVFPCSKVTYHILIFARCSLISIAGFLDSIVAAKQNAGRFGYDISPNRELVALGASNIVASFVPGTLPAYGSITRLVRIFYYRSIIHEIFVCRSKVNGDVGGRTQMASLVCSAVVLLATFFLLPWLYYLPRCVLASM